MKPKQGSKFLARFEVTDGTKFRLKDFKPDDRTGDPGTGDALEALLAADVARLAELQELLYADGTWSLLCVFQGMDASGKDGTIRHVMTGVNPQGIEVTSFKAPGPEEIAQKRLTIYPPRAVDNFWQYYNRKLDRTEGTPT